VAKKTQPKKSLLGSLRKIIGGPPSDAQHAKKLGKSRKSSKDRSPRRDMLAPFQLPMLDLDPLVHPTKNKNPRIPPKLNIGTVLISQRHGIKCVLLDPIEEVDIAILKDICLRKVLPDQAAFLPMGSQLLKDEILHQSREFVIKLRKRTIFISPGGHPVGFLLSDLSLPLRREVSSILDYLPLTESTAKNSLQKLVDIPSSFALIKEDVFYDTSEAPSTVNKGTLVISRGGGLAGLMLENVNLPLKKNVADLDAMFTLKSTYESVPIETLALQASKTSKDIPIERGTFLFSPHGKVYFIWREGVIASEQQLKAWAMANTIADSEVLEVSVTQNNTIGGPGKVITQDEINYLRDVFRQAGSTNIYRETLILDKNTFYKFNQDMPYAQTGKFRSYIHTGQITLLNTFRKGTFSVELGGNKIEISDLDLVQIRKHLQPEGRLLVKIGTLLRIRDERGGDWVYRVINNLFYPYNTLTRPYMEEFIPDTIAFDHRADKVSTLIGPQDNPTDDDIGASGAPLSDLLALINNELSKDRTAFVLDGTLFFLGKRLYRVNEELSFSPQHTSKLELRDLEALEAEWKIHPYVDEGAEVEEDIPSEALAFDEDELEDLPFDTSARS
jgi:hypothetical protein